MVTVASPLEWSLFLAFVLGMLALDLGVFHRKSHVMGLREALGWTFTWIALALAFAGFVLHAHGAERSIEFLSGYLVEKALSVDNIFVFVVIFGALGIPSHLQHRVLFWGVLSALVLRAAMIFGGVALLERFHFLIYVFGAFLVFTGVRIASTSEHEPHPERSLAFRLAQRLIPHTSSLTSPHFIVREAGKLVATPLFMALVLVEASDVLFALDSIPAIFAITRDPFIVFTSNIFAILGLRSLFFVLADAVQRFSYLKLGLAAVLVFVGAKMCVAEWVHIGPALSLGVIVAILATSVLVSLLKTRPAAHAGALAD